MNKLEAIQKRHSVRNYLDRPIEKELVEKLKKEIEIIPKIYYINKIYILIL